MQMRLAFFTISATLLPPLFINFSSLKEEHGSAEEVVSFLIRPVVVFHTVHVNVGYMSFYVPLKMQ